MKKALVAVVGKEIINSFEQQGRCFTIILADKRTIKAGQKVEIRLTW